MCKKVTKKKAYHLPWDLCENGICHNEDYDDEVYDDGNGCTFLDLTDKELVDLWQKLQYKRNPVWVNLRNKIEDVAEICLHCGKLLDE